LHKAILPTLLLMVGSTASGADDPASKLRSARSLRCAFTSSVVTTIKEGRKTVGPTNDKGSAVYDNINIAKGTARIVANSGAGDISVWVDVQGNLWMLERAPWGSEIVTTIFPMYAEGTTISFYWSRDIGLQLGEILPPGKWLMELARFWNDICLTRCAERSPVSENLK
jgi:hypothetical protein